MRKFLTSTLALWATICFTIPDENFTDFTDDHALRFDYQENIIDEEEVSTPNPETKVQFNKRRVMEDMMKDAQQGADMRTEKAARDARPDRTDYNITVE
jgi:hypothetical protein